MKRTPLKRKTRLRPVNRARRKRRYEEAFGEKAAWIRSLPCVCCARFPTQASHVKSRGAGGTKADLLPMCARCHTDFHLWGRGTFEKAWSIDLTLEALDYESRWGGVDLDVESDSHGGADLTSGSDTRCGAEYRYEIEGISGAASLREREGRHGADMADGTETSIGAEHPYVNDDGRGAEVCSEIERSYGAETQK